MPTGYTAGIIDGTVTTFSDYALSCARAFGALIHMRDDANDAALREDTVSTYHLDAARRDSDQLAELNQMSDDEATARAAAEHEQRVAERTRTERNREEAEARYNAMLAQAQQWTPPTPDHEELKRFMCQQITESMKFDCSRYDLGPLVMQTGAEWRAARRTVLEDSILYHERNLREDMDRVEKRNRWVRDLRESLAETHVRA